MASRQPAFQFYPADWRKDPKLQMCSMMTQGVWINLLCAMWEQNPKGRITGSKAEFCRLLGCTPREFAAFLRENTLHKFADVAIRNGAVTVENRRMVREEKARQKTRERVARHRADDGNDLVTPDVRECNNHPSTTTTTTTTSSSSSSGTKVPNNNGAVVDIFEGTMSEVFDAWQHYIAPVLGPLEGERLRNLAAWMAKEMDGLIDSGETVQSIIAFEIQQVAKKQPPASKPLSYLEGIIRNKLKEMKARALAG